jgi:hypothetical protein
MESLLSDTGRFSQRKVRLVSIAACRRVAHLLPNAGYAAVIEWAEQYSDGLADRGAFLSHSRRLAGATRKRHPAATDAAIRAVLSLGPESAPDAATLQAVDARGFEAMAGAGCVSPTLTHAGASRVIQDAWGSVTHAVFDRACEAEELALADLVREVFGNPFRPVAISPAWRTPQVVALAQAAYDQRELPAGTLDPARMAVLADALEEAGCDNADILSHLRGPGPHVRGCWAVDLLLGKS